MDSSTINKIMRKDKDFIGCFAFDNLPKIPAKFPAKFIINTGAAKTDGEHWVAVLMNSKECFYFDSFGLPIINVELLEYIKNKYKSVIYSEVCIQHHLSNMCGPFCIYFLSMVKTKESYRKFINSFSHNDLLVNDKRMEKYLNKVKIKI